MRGPEDEEDDPEVEYLEDEEEYPPEAPNDAVKEWA
jgi:hypothetical protein